MSAVGDSFERPGAGVRVGGRIKGRVRVGVGVRVRGRVRGSSPKSVSLTWPSLSSSTFSGFRSR